MAIPDPIVLLAFPRTGSSMIAGIFAAHGVFTGQTTPATSWAPSGTFGNYRIKKVLKTGHPAGLQDLAKPVPNFQSRLDAAIIADGYRKGPWLIKCAAIYWPLFDDMDPDFVLIRRKPDAVVKSNEATMITGLSGDEFEKARQLYEEQIDLLEMDGYPVVDSEDVVDGDFRALADAFDSCGLEFKPEIARDVIMTDQWHYR